MPTFIEIPEWPRLLPFRAFIDYGDGQVYPHRHKAIEIIQAVTNQTRIGVDGLTYTLSEGEIFLFASGQPHYFLPSPHSTRNVFQFELSIYDFQLMQTTLSSVSEALAYRPHYSRNWPLAVADQITQILQSLLSVANDPGSKATIIGYLYLFLDCVIHQLPEIPNACQIPLPSKALQSSIITNQLNTLYDYINQHYCQSITLTAAASLLGFNPQYFTRFFKKNTGTTFSRFLLDYRLMKASFILVESDKSIPEVAEDCGFQSVKTFHHDFKRNMGISPLSYRKIQRTNKK